MILTLVTADYITTAGTGESFSGSAVIGLPNSHALLLDLLHELGSGEVSRVRVADLSGSSWSIGSETTFANGGTAVSHTMTATSTGDVVLMTGKDGRGYRLISVDQATDSASVGLLVSAGSGNTVVGQKGARLAGTDNLIFLRTTESGTYAEAVNVSGSTLTVLDTLALDTGAGAGDGWGAVVAIDTTSAFAALSLTDDTLRIYRIVLTSGSLSASSSDVSVAYAPYAELYSATAAGYTAEILLPDPGDPGQYIRRGIKYASGIVVDTLTLGAIDYSTRPPDTALAWGIEATLPSTFIPTPSSLVVARPIQLGGSDPNGGRFVVLEYAGGTIASYNWDESGRGTGAGDARDLSGFYDGARGRVYISDTDAYTLDYVGGTQGPYTITNVDADYVPAGGSVSGMSVTITATRDATYGVTDDYAVFDISQSAAEPVIPNLWQMRGTAAYYTKYGPGSSDAETVTTFQTVPRHSETATTGPTRNMHHIEWWYADFAGNPAQYVGTYVPIGFPDTETVRPPFDHRFGVSFSIGPMDLTLTNFRVSGTHLYVDWATTSGLPSDRFVTFSAAHWYRWVQFAYSPPYTAGELEAGTFGSFGGLSGPITAGSSGTLDAVQVGGLFNDTDIRNYYLVLFVRNGHGDFLTGFESVGTPFAPAYKAAAGDIRFLEFTAPPLLVLTDAGSSGRWLFN